ncbi:MAG: hypothetical protein HC860_07830 [Alkalinema sp. RU_4_3]|nr:hypothetical protein [Alkalinema sp. RU_4_3]
MFTKVIGDEAGILEEVGDWHWKVPATCLYYSAIASGGAIDMTLASAIPNSDHTPTHQSPGGTARLARNSFAVRFRQQ